VASQRLVVRFEDRWVDLTGWRKAHPAGEMWIDEFKGMDATEVSPKGPSSLASCDVRELERYLFLSVLVCVLLLLLFEQTGCCPRQGPAPF